MKAVIKMNHNLWKRQGSISIYLRGIRKECDYLNNRAYQ